MLNRISELLSENENSASETTLSTKSYKSKITEAKEKGYRVILLFIGFKILTGQKNGLEREF